MRCLLALSTIVLAPQCSFLLAQSHAPFTKDPQQLLERTCFQTGQAWSGAGNLRSDVAIVYGIDAGLPKRIETWREHGYRIHIMTGVAWGQYQEYVSGKFDGVKHEDEAQTDRQGNPHRHGNSHDIFYMCPGTNYGKFLCVGVQRALEAGAEAIHLEEPEFWVQDGYEEGFKREWQSFYGEAWQPPDSSVDAQWRASKLKYFLYRRALQQVFDYVQAYNARSGRAVRCYVPTHSLLNYAHWRIVSPESSLARLEGCNGYIAQVWTGTARTPNLYRGQLRERTFETAFLEYGAMQNLVRSTGRTVWYLNDPIEDNPRHDWNDYRANWESTLVASLFQPEVWQFEVAPWPERVFLGRYPHGAAHPEPIPAAYATELQTVINALNDLHQKRVEWDCGTPGLGVLVSDSLMFERGDPSPSDAHLSQVYGLAMPLLKHGMPVTPVQLENVTVPHYLDAFRLLLLSYYGMKPLDAAVHQALAGWVKAGGILVVCDDDADPYNQVREWWNSNENHYNSPRQHLFEQLSWQGGAANRAQGVRFNPVHKGGVIWLQQNPAKLAADPQGADQLLQVVRQAAASKRLKWRETNHLLLRRGPYVIAAGLSESTPEEAKELRGNFVNLFDSQLKLQHLVRLAPGSRHFLLDLEEVKRRGPQLLASACKAQPLSQTAQSLSFTVEGVAETQAILLLRVPGKTPPLISLEDQPLTSSEFSALDHLLWIRFPNEARPRELSIRF